MNGPQITTQATVIRRKPGQVTISAAASAGCGGCAQKAACAPDAKMDFARLKLACADLPKGRLNSGASVSVSIPASLFTRMVLMCYLLPALLMVVGAALGPLFVNQHPDVWALLGASSGLMLGCAVLRLYDSRFCSPGLGEQPGTASHSSPVFLTES